MEAKQLKTQENQPEDSKALAEFLNQQKVRKQLNCIYFYKLSASNPNIVFIYRFWSQKLSKNKAKLRNARSIQSSMQLE